ncbi:MAG: InlB B-repeat-containing protein [Clostridia bacterium]|nr:InlB B-repeat-containing protein [Clostridia bacterium]
MKTRKFLAILMAVAMVVMSFAGLTAQASGEGWIITTERVGDDLKVSFALSEDLELAAGAFAWPTFDRDAFSMTTDKTSTDVEVNSELSNGLVGNSNTLLMTSDGLNVLLPAGTVIITYTFHINTSNFDENEVYTFSFETEDICDEDGNIFEDYSSNYCGPFVFTYPEATEPQPSEPTTHTVKFVSNGVVLSEVEVNDGETVAEPAEPTREGYTFKGWKLNGADYDFTTPVTSNLTLTAAWEANEGTMNTDVDLGNISITKNVQAGDNEYDEITFEFKVEPVSVDSPVTTDIPAISNLTVTMSGDDTTATVNFPSDVSFPGGGVYTYHITEVTPDPVPEGWTYNANNNQYYLVLEVEPNGNALILDKVVIHSGTADGAKADEMSFTNVYDYEPVTDLTITKTVVGEPDNPVDGTVKFDFEITFTESFTGIIKGEEVTFIADVPYEFQLGNGESLFIENIPAGISYTIVEKGNEYYKGSAIAYENDVKADEVGAENFGEDVRISADAVIAESGKNKVDFTNTYGIPPITGITMHGEMIAIIALALVALVGGFVLSRKLRRSED